MPRTPTQIPSAADSSALLRSPAHKARRASSWALHGMPEAVDNALKAIAQNFSSGAATLQTDNHKHCSPVFSACPRLPVLQICRGS